MAVYKVSSKHSDDHSPDWWKSASLVSDSNVTVVVNLPSVLYIINDIRYVLKAFKMPISSDCLNVVFSAFRHHQGMELYFVDSLDLLNDDDKAYFIEQCAQDLDIDKKVITEDMTVIIHELTKFRDLQIEQAIEERSRLKTVAVH